MKLKSFLLVSALACGPLASAETTNSDFPAAYSAERFTSSDDKIGGEYKTLSTGQYIGGGLTGMFFGFGLGHAVQERYKEKGWIFTAGGAAFWIGLGGFGYSALKDVPTKLRAYVDELREKPSSAKASAEASDEGFSAAEISFLSLTLIGLGIKIWERIDVWKLPSHYRVVKESPFQIKPLAFYDSNADLNLGLSLNYKF